jgi:hypothetical protein
LKGPKFILRPVNNWEKDAKRFFSRELELVAEILNIVFTKAANIPYMKEVTSIREFLHNLEYETSNELRRAITMFEANGNGAD